MNKFFTLQLCGLIACSSLIAPAHAEHEAGGRVSRLGMSEQKFQAVLAAMTELSYAIVSIKDTGADKADNGELFIVEFSDDQNACKAQGFIVSPDLAATGEMPQYIARPDNVQRVCP